MHQHFDRIVNRAARRRSQGVSARNDVAASVTIIVAGFVTAATHSVWPDIVVGLGIMVMNAGAAREVWLVAREEHRTAVSDQAES